MNRPRRIRLIIVPPRVEGEWGGYVRNANVSGPVCHHILFRIRISRGGKRRKCVAR